MRLRLNSFRIGQLRRLVFSVFQDNIQLQDSERLQPGIWSQLELQTENLIVSATYYP
jgi:hypothetical protein